MSFFLSVGAVVVASVFSACSIVVARHRVDYLRLTGETFARRDVSRSRSVAAVVVVAVAITSATAAHTLGQSLALLGVLFALSGCVYLAFIDIDTHLLPWGDSMLVGVVPSLIFIVDAMIHSRPDVVLVMLGCGVGALIVFILIERLSRGDLGGGDVVLVGVLATMLGYFGVSAVMQSLFYALLTAGVFALGAMVLLGFRTRTAFAFGPFLILGAVVVMTTSRPLWVVV
jgi:leader peptidase (prepilin peptidase) / N-methyltransferase